MTERKLSPWESLYVAAERLIPPCAIQMLLTVEGEVDIELFRQQEKHVFEWDQSESILKTPLQEPGGAEIWVGKNQILFRVSHVLMDGRGALIWMRRIFKSLRGEPVGELDNRLTAQDLLTAVQSAKEGGGYQFANIPDSRKYFFQTKRITTARSNLLSKMAARIPEYFELESARIMVPVDLRRYVPEITHMGNLSAPIFLEVPKGIAWQKVQEQLLMRLFEKQELAQDRSLDGFLKLAPQWVIRSVLKSLLKWQDFKKSYRASAIISDFGKVNLSDFSTEIMKAVSLRAHPVHTGLVPLSIAMVDCGTHTEMGLACAEGDGLAQKCERFLDDLGGLVDFFEMRVRKTPDQIAVVCEDRQLTYRELDEKSKALEDERPIVAFSLPRTEQALIRILTILKSGAAYLPIDPEYPEERKNLMGPTFAEATAGKDLAYVLYTSGSTGQPKGVMIGHESLANYLLWARDFYHIEPKTRFGLFTSLSFDLSVSSLFLSLLWGNGVEIFPGQFDFEQIARITDSAGVNALKLTPTHLEYFCRLKMPADKFKRLIVGGEQFKASLAQKAQDLFGEACQIYNEYGPTEATVGCISYYDEHLDSVVMPIGKPMRGAEIYLINSEIYIAGDCLALGYLNQPELTREKFVLLPNQQRAYRTGDLGRIENGLWFFEGRVDAQIKIKGCRIEPAEIEEAMLTHPQVLQARVMGEEQSLVAYYVAAGELDGLVLKAYLREKLPSYLIPNLALQVHEISMSVHGKTQGALDSLQMLELMAELSADKKISPEDLQAIIRAC